MSNIVDLVKLRQFKFKYPKKRGRPSKTVLHPYPRDLKLTLEFYDLDGDFKSIVIQVEDGPFSLKNMELHYKKFLVEISIKLAAEMCMDDPAMIVELQDYLEQCIMNRSGDLK